MLWTPFPVNILLRTFKFVLALLNSLSILVGLCQYFFYNDMIDNNSILYYIEPDSYLEADVFKPFIEQCYKDIDPFIGKSIVNQTIGVLNKQTTTRYSGFITDNEDICHAMKNAYSEKNNVSVNIIPLNDDENTLWFVKKEVTLNNDLTNSNIYRHIICASIKGLLELACDASSKGQILAINTDSVFIETKEDPIELATELTDDFRTIVYKNNEDINKICVKDQEPRTIETHRLIGNGSINYGPGGTGKAMKLVEMFKAEMGNKRIALSYTNSVVSKLIDDITESLEEEELKKVSSTFHSLLFENLEDSELITKLSKYDVVFVDEFSLVPLRYMNLLLMTYKKKKLNGERFDVHLFGDSNQIHPISDKNCKTYNYMKNDVVRRMCPNIIELKRSEHSRCEPALYDIIDNLLATNKLDLSLFKPIDESLLTNIVAINNTRRNVSKRLTEASAVLSNIVIKIKMKSTRLVLVCQYIQLKHLKRKIFTNDKKITLGPLELSIKDFSNSFLPAYAATCHKSQGRTIDYDYNIYDVACPTMTTEMMYVAISRARKISQIHIETSESSSIATFRPSYYNSIPSPISPTKMNHGWIYELQIRIDDKLHYYIGMTERQDPNIRMNEHDEEFKKLGSIESKREIIEVYYITKKDNEAVETTYIQAAIKEHGRDYIINKKQLRANSKEQ